MENVLVTRWYGPLLQDDVKEWEKTQDATFNLYLIGGKKKNAKTKIHYYIGKAERKMLSNRLNDRNHHIIDFSRVNEIWLGTIVNKKVTHNDVLDAEKMLTSYFASEGELLVNVINRYLPNKSIYLINEWIHCRRNLECLRLPKTSIANKMPDVIVYKIDDCSDEYKIFVSRKLKVVK